MNGIDREIEDNYGLKVLDMSPYREALIITTTGGCKVARRLPFSQERLKFVHGAKEHLFNNGFTGVDRYLCTLSGEPFFLYNNATYTLVDLIEGRECNFDNPNDVKKAAIALAYLHKASRGYIAPPGSKIQDELGKLPAYFSKRLDDIRKMKKQAKKCNGRFDQLVLQHADFFISWGEKAIEDLAASRYRNIVENSRNERILCHHDYTHHNIIINGDMTSVINFDYCCHEIRVYDLANLLRRKMRKCGWDIAKAVMIINAYNSADKLNEEEISVMGAILRFPQKFWRVVNRYYNSRRSWSEKVFIMRMQEVIDEIGPFGEFMRQYREMLG